MNCAEMRRVAAAWENGYILECEEAQGACLHAASCPGCRSAYPIFLALASRDSMEGSSTRIPSAAATELADRVMADILPSVRVPRRRSLRFPHRRRISSVAVAAIVCSALFAIGLIGRETRTVPVRFVLEAPEANSVFLAGDFSAWNPKGLELRKTEDGVWERTVRLRRGKSYSYNFLVDGTSWVVDPAAPERIDDGFGGESALIRL